MPEHRAACVPLYTSRSYSYGENLSFQRENENLGQKDRWLLKVINDWLGTSLKQSSLGNDHQENSNLIHQIMCISYLCEIADGVYGSIGNNLFIITNKYLTTVRLCTFDFKPHSRWLPPNGISAIKRCCCILVYYYIVLSLLPCFWKHQVTWFLIDYFGSIK